MAKKRCEAWLIVDLEIPAGVCRVSSPGNISIEEVVADGFEWIDGGIENRRERYEGARCKYQNQKNKRADGREPSGVKKRKEHDKQLVAGDSQPREGDIQ